MRIYAIDSLLKSSEKLRRFENSMKVFHFNSEKKFLNILQNEKLYFNDKYIAI